ncbi:MAG: MFS transporter [Tannerellaceae bacterium]|jgi:fucose permease|nr:MFS transporter [Tannerellaceae bacterium]
MKKNHILLVLILCIWFVISFVTNITGPMLPMVITDFHLSLTLASFLPFSFFLAYGVMSVPAGMIIERYGGKTSLLAAFGFAFVGAFMFVLFPVYGVVLASLFIIGTGMAMLQVIILPLMREAGGKRNYAFYTVLAQVVFGSASFLSPFVLTGLLHQLVNPSTESTCFIRCLKSMIPESLPWSSLYLIFTGVFALMLVLISIIQFPKVQLREEEKTGALQHYPILLKNKQVILFFLGIVAYVGTEQGLANWMSQFLYDYHGVSPDESGAVTVAWFWGMITIGCLLGLLLIRLMDSRIMLRYFAVLAFINLSVALFAPANIALIAFPCCGFFISVMFSILFSLALNSVEKYHGAFSGILCTGIFGGAVLPFLIGWLGDWVGLRFSMTLLFVTLAYIFGLSFWAKPLVSNKTIRLKEMLSFLARPQPKR